MASAARAYQQRPQRASEQSPRIHVLPGRGSQKDSAVLSPAVISLARMCAVVLVVFALLGFARIALVSATVSTAVAAEGVSSQIESARAAGSELEVRETYLSNPSSLRSSAIALGMGEPADNAALMLTPDVVAVNEAGDLSLAGTLKALSQG